ncbi:hypothetical protein [Xenorhabdus sp. PB62.4]|uniref:hypothetical protein n=1 Tax=Xenorhabdus sp. PB62.4 TaxID=1851573 RepID=UPI00165752F0|nr:hypothetical protein [Xenorhabdus sp. PB62.4]
MPVEQSADLIDYLTASLLRAIAQIVAYARGYWQIIFILAGMTKWFHHQASTTRNP